MRAGSARGGGWRLPFGALLLLACAASFADAYTPQTEVDRGIQACIDVQNAKLGASYEQGDKCALDCNIEASQKYDAELNQVYDELRKQLQGSREEAALVSSERVWLRKREALCIDKLVSDSGLDDGGDTDMRQQVAIGENWCLADKTWSRVQVLKRKLKASKP